jgi:hypothetical protein
MEWGFWRIYFCITICIKRKKLHLCNPKRGKRLTERSSAGSREEKKQIKFCIFKKASYLCRPKREAVPEAEKNIPEKVWKRRGRRLNFAVPEGGRKTEEKKNQAGTARGNEKRLTFASLPGDGANGRRLQQSARKAPGSSLKYCRKTKRRLSPAPVPETINIRKGTTMG